jgi:hypothetical protein
LEVVVFDVLDALRCAAGVVVEVSDWPVASCAQTEAAVIEKTTAIAMERWFLFTDFPELQGLNRYPHSSTRHYLSIIEG